MKSILSVAMEVISDWDGNEKAILLVLNRVIPTLELMGTALAPLFDEVRKAIVQWRIASVREYEEAGFTREQAILLVLADHAAQQELLRSVNRSGATSATK